MRLCRGNHDMPPGGVPHSRSRLEFPLTRASLGLRFSFRVLPESTVATIASRHRFPEVFRPCSAFDHGSDALPCPTETAVFGVSTSLTVNATRDLFPACVGNSLLGFTLRSFFLSPGPTRLPMPNESRNRNEPFSTFLTFARLPLPKVESDE